MNTCGNVQKTKFRGNMVCKVKDYQISTFCEKFQVFSFIFNYFWNSSDAASLESTGSDELDETKITNLQEIIKPHPNLVNRMYFL